MTFLRRSLYFALVVGFSFSVVLVLSEDRHGGIRLTLQLPGLLVGWYVSTVYGGKVGDIVMVIVNGVIYSGLLLIVCGMVRLASRARQ